MHSDNMLSRITTYCKNVKILTRSPLKGESLFHFDDQPELNLETDYPNKTGHSLKPNSSISVL